MRPVVYINADVTKHYEDNSFLGRIRDRLKIHYLGRSFIKELNLSIVNISLPPNFNKKAYYNNLSIAKKTFKKRDVQLALKTYRKLDYNLYNKFQKELMAYGIVRSIKLILRIKHKTIRDSCIVIYDAADDMNFDVICSLAKEAKYLILLSKNIRKINIIGEYVVANYGITPIITSDIEYSFNNADFIINSEDMELNTETAVWYINNKVIPVKKGEIIVNDVTYSVPWQLEKTSVSTELLGSILCQMEEKDIEKSLQYNGVFLNEIKFNEDTWKMN